MSLPTPSSTDTLVDDILIETFAFLALPSHQSFRDVLTVSHVCRRWRRLALSSPELWRRFAFLPRKHIDFGGLQLVAIDESFTNTILGRCGELTLDAGWDSESDRPVGVLRRELGMRERLRRYSLPLFAGEPNWWNLLTSRPTFEPTNQGQTPGTSSFIALEDLSLIGMGTRLRYLPLDSMKWLFGEDLRIPRLRKLALTNMSTDVRVLSLPKLEELDWEIEPYYPLEPVGPHTAYPPCIFETLNAHVGLRRLRIHQGHPVRTHPVPGFQLELPHLVELDLAMDFTCVSLLLSHLSLPKCRSVKVTFLGCEDPVDGDAGEAEALRDMVVRATEQIIEWVVVPLISQRRQQESSGNAVLFLRCMEMAVEYIFSPHLNDAPYPARDPSPDDVTVVIGFPWPLGKTTMRGVLDGWVSACSGSSFVKVTCLDLSDNNLVVEEYSEVVEEFVRNPSVGVERVMYSSDWARTFGEVEGVVEPMAQERISAIDPLAEVITAAGSERDGIAVPR